MSAAAAIRDDRPALPARLLQLARDVRRIGSPYRATPEDIALAKDAVARELASIARDLESGQ